MFKLRDMMLVVYPSILLQCYLLLWIHGVHSQGVSHDCPVNEGGGPTLIYPGVRVNCKCVLDDPGAGNGMVRWIHPAGYVLAEAVKEVTFSLGYHDEGMLVCDEGWTVYPGGQACIKRFNTPKNWQDARGLCQGISADLIKISDEAFNQFLIDTLTPNSGSFWIGLKDPNNDNSWKWLDEPDKAPFLFWTKDHSTKPNQPDGSSHGCAVVSTDHEFGWDDLDCSTTTTDYMCQKAAVIKNNHGQTYICEGTSNLGHVFKTEYKTNFAFGPTTVTASQGKIVFPLHQNEGPISVKCIVSKDNANPKPNIALVFDGSDITPDADNEEGDTWTYSFNFRPGIPNVYKAKCVASSGTGRAEALVSIDAQGYTQVTLDGCPFDSDGVTESYLRVGNSQTCVCKRTVAGNPVGDVYWIDQDGGESTDATNAILDLSSVDKHEKVFKCVGKNSLGEGSSFQYTPKFAYGPSALSITGPNTPLSLCPDGISGVRLPCFDMVSNVNPAPVIRLEGTPEGSSGSTIVQHDTGAGLYVGYFHLSWPTGGVYSITCVGVNTIFNDIRDTFVLGGITVHEPPPSPPTVTIDGNGISEGESYIVEEGVALTIVCGVSGGYPDVTSVTINCGGQTKTTAGVESTMSLKVDRSMNQAACACSAQHISGCYTKVTNFILDIKYVRSLTITCGGQTENTPGDNSTMTVIVDKSMTTACSCDADHVSGCYTKSISFSLDIRYGPSTVTYGSSDKESYTLSKEDLGSAKIEVNCVVASANFLSHISATLKGLPGGDVTLDEPTSKNEASSNFQFDFTPTVLQNLTLECVVYNTNFNHITAEVTRPLDILGFPQVALSGCPEDFIREGLNVPCLCTLTKPGNPVGKAYWFAPDGSMISEDAMAASLSLNSRDQANNQYKCIGKSHLGDGEEKLYTPKFAYGPAFITFGPAGTTEVELDSIGPDGVALYCEVAEGSFVEDITMTIAGAPQGTITTPQVPFAVEGANRKYNFAFKPTVAGIFELECIAKNNHISEIDIKTPKTLSILGPPKVSLSDCPLESDNTEKYILEGLGITCKCKLTETGNPVGEAYWYRPDGAVLARDATEAILLLNSREQENKGFKCVGRNENGDGDSLTYTPKFAYGPTGLQTVVDNNPVLKLCPRQTRSFSFGCRYKTSEANPQPNIVVKVNPDKVLQYRDIKNEVSGVDRLTKHIFTVKLEVSGEYTLTCLGSNDIFPSITDQVTKTGLIVAEPPPSPPTVTIDGNGISEGESYMVKEGVTLSIVCNVNGGYPDVTSVTITCGGQTENTPGVESTMSLKVDRSMNQAACSCSAQHISECYTKVTGFILDVKYGPDSIIPGPGHISVFYLTESTRSNDVTMFCEVPEDQFASHINVSMEGTSEGTLSPDSPFVSTNGIRRYKFTFRPGVAVNLTLECVAFNFHYPELIARTPKRFDILEFPVVSLQSDCPFDNDGPSYIKEGVTKTCTCALTTVGNPHGFARWKDYTDKVISEHNSSTTLQLLYDPDDLHNEYKCLAKSYLGLGNSITYEAKFAYGPKALTASSVPIPAVKLCPGMSRSVVIDCQVPASAVNPSATIDLTDLPHGEAYYSSSDKSDSSHFRKRFWFDLNKAGEYSVTCVASNSKFPDITKTFTKTGIIAQEPPTSPPTITTLNDVIVSNGSSQVVQLGDTLDVTCSVDGGFPLVDSVTLMCGNKSETSNGRVLSLSLLINKSMNQDTCVCTAQHTTGCYDQMTQFSLDVKYSAAEPHFTVNSQTDAISISTGSNVTFRCTSEGNPKPDVSISGQSSQVVLASSVVSSTPFVQEFESTFVAELGHSDEYICFANNGIGGSVQRSVKVTVLGPPELDSRRQHDFTTTILNDGKMSIDFYVVSNPAPSVWTLVKVDSDNESQTKSNFISSSEDVQFKNKSFPFMTAAIEFVSPPYDEENHYRLTLDNGLGKLVINFTAVLGNSVEKNEFISENLRYLVGGGAGGAVLLLAVISISVYVNRINKAPKIDVPYHEEQQSNPYSYQNDNQRYWKPLRGLNEMRLPKVSIQMPK